MTLSSLRATAQRLMKATPGAALSTQKFGLRRALTDWLAIGSLAMLVACGTAPKDDPNSQASLDKLYAEARDDVASGSYDRAIKTLERIEEPGFSPEHRVPVTNTAGQVVKKPKKPKKPKGSAAVLKVDVRFR